MYFYWNSNTIVTTFHSMKFISIKLTKTANEITHYSWILSLQFLLVFIFCCRSQKKKGWWRKSTWSKKSSSLFKTCSTRSPVLERELKSKIWISIMKYSLLQLNIYLYFSERNLKCFESSWTYFNCYFTTFLVSWNQSSSSSNFKKKKTFFAICPWTSDEK